MPKPIKVSKPVLMLKAMRKQRNITQKDMAEVLSISIQAYKSKENGAYEFTAKEAWGLCKKLGTTFAILFGGVYDADR